MGSALDARERVVAIGDEVLGVLYADAEPQRPIGDAEPSAPLRGHAAVRGDRGIEDLAPEIAHRRRGRGELERVEEAERGVLVRRLQVERDHAAEQTAELPLRELVLRM